MHYVSHGSGERLVVGLHGWTGDHTHFDALAQYAPVGTRLVAFDLPGFGKSKAPDSWAMEDVGRELAAEIDRLQGRTLSIVTNCSGAYPALMSARHLARQPEKMVLVDAFAYAPKYFRVFTNRSWGHHAYHTTFANPIGRRLTNFSLRGQKRDMTADFKTANHAHTLAWLRSCVELGDCRQFAHLRIPTLIAHGEATFTAVRKSLPMWREIWPHAETLQLKGAGHLGLIEAAAQLSESVFTPATAKGASHAA